MKRLAVVLLFSTLLFGCSESDDICNDRCYKVVLVENGNRDCGTSSCNYTFNLLLENTCTKELSSWRTRFISIGQKPTQGSEICNTNSLIRR